MPSQGSIVVGTPMCNSAADFALSGGLPREDGVVKSFNKSKGYGFIRIQSRTDDVYFKTEDLTPRSKRFAEEAPRINGAPITCAPEAFGESRVRARSVRLGDVATGAKQSNSICTGDPGLIKSAAAEPSLSVSKTVLPAVGTVRPWSKKAPVSTRPRGWGVLSAEEVTRRKAELMAMGFSEEAAQDALASGLDFNEVLDALLSGRSLPTKRLSSDELATRESSESLPTTREGSDDASEDRSSSCGTGDKSPEAVEKTPLGNLEADDVLLAACETDLPQESVSNNTLIQALNEASEAVLPVRQASSENTEPRAISIPTRQLARVRSPWLEGSSAASQLSVRRGALIHTWTGSATEQGWIYAERLDNRGLAGWIPTNVLTLLPVGYQWRRVTKNCPSFSDSHLAGEQSEIILVDCDSIEQGSDQGWVHAERLDGAQVGWFPTCALEQLPAQLRWMPVVNSLEAHHETQATVEAGDMVLVDPETRTKEGWVYAWAADRCHGDSTKQSAQAGWVPVNCLEWLHE